MDAKKIGDLLATLEAQLHSQGENNWIRGVRAARQALQQPDGLDDARSIYATITKGVNSFADYNIWHDDFDVRRKLNGEVDRLRRELWTEFEL